MVKFLGSLFGSASFKTTLAVGLLTIGAFAAKAEAVVLPSIGTDVGSYISAAILLLGGVVGIAVGGYAAFLVVKKALKWLGKSLS